MWRQAVSMTTVVMIVFPWGRSHAWHEEEIGGCCAFSEAENQMPSKRAKVPVTPAREASHSRRLRFNPHHPKKRSEGP